MRRGVKNITDEQKQNLQDSTEEIKNESFNNLEKIIFILSTPNLIDLKKKE